jgi:hypothetical protein
MTQRSRVQILGTDLGDKGQGIRDLRGVSGHRSRRPAKARRSTKTRREARLFRPAAEYVNLHGKEGVDGSSPSEGFPKRPAKGQFVLPAMARFRRFAGTRRVHFRTGGHSRARATSRDTAGMCSRSSSASTHSRGSCKEAHLVARTGAMLTPSLTREGSALPRSRRSSNSSTSTPI